MDAPSSTQDVTISVTAAPVTQQNAVNPVVPAPVTQQSNFTPAAPVIQQNVINAVVSAPVTQLKDLIPTSMPQYLVWSWLNFFLNPCGLLCSILALMSSYLTQVYNKAGNQPAAKAKSRLALACNIVALVTFLLVVGGIAAAIAVTIGPLMKLIASFTSASQAASNYQDDASAGSYSG